MVAVDRRRTLQQLMVIVGLQWLGASLGLPLLPLFLEHRGGTPSVIGIIMSAFFLAGVATQFALGHLVDRFGRRTILLTSLLVYAVASMTYLLPVSAPVFILTRMLQGAAAGAIEVASLSAVAALYPEHERGRAVSRIFAAQLFGLAVGPVAGVAVSVRALGWAYFATGILCLIATVPARRLALGDPTDSGPLPPLQWTRNVVGALLAASAVGVAVGVYETCWTLLMHAHHATTLQIRLSFTLFSVPWVAFSRLGGWLADHRNRRVIALVGLTNVAFFLSLYPHIHSNVALLWLGSVEAIGSSLSSPSIASLLTQRSSDREFGRRQGLYATANTASLALAALTSGAMFSVNPVLPFTVMAVLSMVLTLAATIWWRGVAGNVRAPRTSSPT
ncbi:MAG: MFS transporter [Acidimicrobiales bacterium]